MQINLNTPQQNTSVLKRQQHPAWNISTKYSTSHVNCKSIREARTEHHLNFRTVCITRFSCTPRLHRLTSFCSLLSSLEYILGYYETPRQSTPTWSSLDASPCPDRLFKPRLMFILHPSSRPILYSIRS